MSSPSPCATGTNTVTETAAASGTPPSPTPGVVVPKTNGDGAVVKRIAVLTAGGDCPGLNATIRAITFDAFGNGIEVIGIEDGILGLIQDRMKPLTLDDVR